MNAVLGVPVEDGMHRPVDMQQHAVVAAPVGKGRVRAEPGREVIMHDDPATQFLGKLGPFEHFLNSWGRDIQVMPLALAGLGFSLINRFNHVFKSVAPAHERLRVDVFIVLGEIETATKALIDGAPVILRRQAELRLDSTSQERAAILVELIALYGDAVRRAATGQHIVKGKTNVLQSQRTQSFEAKHIAHKRGQHIDYRSLLKQIDRIGDKGVVAFIVTRHVFDLIGTAFVIVQIGQQVGPHCRPGAGGGFRSDSSGNLFPGEARLRRYLEAGEQIAWFGFIVGFPVGLPIVLHAGFKFAWCVRFFSHCKLLVSV